MLLRGNTRVWLGCTETWSTRISTVLHWRPPDVHIFLYRPIATSKNPLETLVEYRMYYLQELCMLQDSSDSIKEPFDWMASKQFLIDVLDQFTNVQAKVGVETASHVSRDHSIF